MWAVFKSSLSLLRQKRKFLGVRDYHRPKSYFRGLVGQPNVEFDVGPVFSLFFLNGQRRDSRCISGRFLFLRFTSLSGSAAEDVQMCVCVSTVKKGMMQRPKIAVAKKEPGPSQTTTRILLPHSRRKERHPYSVGRKPKIAGGAFTRGPREAC